MIDPFGRTITYLRVSVTDRCDFRCVYCMAEEMSFLPKAELLTLEELDRVCSAFVRLGVRKLRLTGGEPLVRRDIMTLFRVARPPPRRGRPRRTDPDDQRQPARPLRRRTCAIAACAGSMSRSTRSTRRNSPRSPGAASSTRCSTGSPPPRRRARGQDQHGGVARRQRGRTRRSRRLVRRRGLRPRLHRGHADGRYRRREPARPVSAAVDGARPAAAALDARRQRLPHRRPGALRRRCARPAGGSASSPR